jgi:hypothetical protein
VLIIKHQRRRRKIRLWQQTSLWQQIQLWQQTCLQYEPYLWHKIHPQHEMSQFEGKSNDLILFFAIQYYITCLGVREWYIYPQSVHWAKSLFSATSMHDLTFYTAFRMSRHSFNKLHNLLSPHIEKRKTNFRQPICSELRLAIFLYHISHGCSYTVLTNLFGIGKSTASSIIGDVSQAIITHMGRRYIRFPSTEQALRTMDYWREKSGIPGVVASIDGCHIPIIQPMNTGSTYFNRNGYYSLNVQGNIAIH